MKHSLLAGFIVWAAFPFCWLVWFYAAWPPRPWGLAAVCATLAEMSVLGLIVGAVVTFMSWRLGSLR
jgi:hypothetical protein